MNWIEEIMKIARGTCRRSVSAASFTTYRIGGPVDLIVYPEDLDDMTQILEYIHDNNVPYYVLGAGSNLLVADSGFRGVFVCVMNTFNGVDINDTQVLAGAGVLVKDLIITCEKNGLSGLENLYGIPGTVGGGIKMNIRAFDVEIGNYVSWVRLYRDRSVIKILRRDMGFAYRDSNVRDKDIVIDTLLELERGESTLIEQARDRIFHLRQSKQPLKFGSCGSTFRNPPGGKSAGQLIDEAGLRGMRHGNAQISEMHANFFVNLGSASSEDIVYLIRLAHSKVKMTTGVELELEVKAVGFEEPIIPV